MIAVNSKSLEVNATNVNSVLNATKAIFNKLGNSFTSAINYLYSQECWVKEEKKED